MNGLDGQNSTWDFMISFIQILWYIVFWCLFMGYLAILILYIVFACSKFVCGVRNALNITGLYWNMASEFYLTATHCIRL